MKLTWRHSLVLTLIVAGIVYAIRRLWLHSLENTVFVLFLVLVWIVWDSERQMLNRFEELRDRLFELDDKLNESKASLNEQIDEKLNGLKEDLAAELTSLKDNVIDVDSKIGELGSNLEDIRNQLDEITME